MGKRHYKIEYSFRQSYSNWHDPNFTAIFIDDSTKTRKILKDLDMLEMYVYNDLDFTLANELISDAIKRNKK